MRPNSRAPAAAVRDERRLAARAQVCPAVGAGRLGVAGMLMSPEEGGRVLVLGLEHTRAWILSGYVPHMPPFWKHGQQPVQFHVRC